jgi:hypothetical protein
MGKIRKLWVALVVIMVAGLLLVPLWPEWDDGIPTTDGYAWSG